MSNASSDKPAERKRSPLPRQERLHVRLDTETLQLLDSHVANNRSRGASRSSEVAAAIRAYVEPQDQTPALFRAINRLENHLATTRARLDMLGNAFLHYLRYWFVLWPDLPPETNKRSQIKANDMLAKFLRSLQRRLDKKDLYQLLDPGQLDAMIGELKQTVTELIARGLANAAEDEGP